jgi:hypothetical protein
MIWVFAPRGWVITFRRFERNCHCYLQVYECENSLITLTTKAAHYMETSGRKHPITWRNNPEDLIAKQPLGKLKSEFSLCWEYIYFWFIQLYHLLCFVDASLFFFLWKNGTINFHNTWMSASIYTQPYYFKNQLLRSACRQIYISQYKRGISFQIAKIYPVNF